MEDKLKKSFRTDFDKIAPIYDKTIGRLDALNYRFVLKNIPRNKQLALDVGCGTGSLCLKLGKIFEKVWGIDFSKGMIKIAKEKSLGRKNINFRRGNAENLNFPNGKFDYVVSLLTFHHTDKEMALKEMIRVLKPSGQLLLIDIVRLDGIELWIARLNFRTKGLLSLGPISYPRVFHFAKTNPYWRKHAERDKPFRFTPSEFKKFFRDQLPSCEIGSVNGYFRYCLWDKK